METRPSQDESFVCSANPGRGVGGGAGGSSGARSGLICTLECFLIVVDYCFLMSLISAGGLATGFPPKFEIFLIFLYFLRSYVLSRFATRKIKRITSLLYQISRFVLLVVNRIFTKTFKVPKYYDQDCSSLLDRAGILHIIRFRPCHKQAEREPTHLM